MTTGRKLMLAGVVVAGVTIYMAYTGASASWQYYLTADECLERIDSLKTARLRVSGKIAPDSLQIAADRSWAVFAFETRRGVLKAVCPGPLPDQLAAGMDVVVEGRLEEGPLLRGEKLLTRCASKYRTQSSASSSGPASPSPIANQK